MSSSPPSSCRLSCWSVVSSFWRAPWQAEPPSKPRRKRLFPWGNLQQMHNKKPWKYSFLHFKEETCINSAFRQLAFFRPTEGDPTRRSDYNPAVPWQLKDYIPVWSRYPTIFLACFFQGSELWFDFSQWFWKLTSERCLKSENLGQRFTGCARIWTRWRRKRRRRRGGEIHEQTRSREVYLDTSFL